MSGQLAQECVDGLSGLDADPAVNGQGAVGPGDDAEIELGDLRKVVGHPGYPQQDVLQRGEVGGWGTAVPQQQRGGAY